MKKVSIYVISVSLIATLAIGGTYAFFTAVIQRNNAVETGSHQLQVQYSGDVAISGEIELVRTKEEGFRRELDIALGPKSVDAAANFFIQVDTITEGFQNKALKWEIYELINEEEKYINSGNFLNINSNSRNYIAEGLVLNQTTRKFVVYVWLYGEEAGNEVLGAKLTGHIGAETETISGILSDKK